MYYTCRYLILPRLHCNVHVYNYLQGLASTNISKAVSIATNILGKNNCNIWYTQLKSYTLQ